ncbi:cell division protein FtsZ [Ramlibacter sp. AW1]|uniref:Cell division protein FtsZ n=1 Tax=Ramlibacter aurantiacus TaxID=2801330 RepID=A0A936ZJF2_9BURK|nr:cell division protein ZipA C-terminal FtsZ-binding domain-containing protein [Ramlibacter aurantiacus]MBL0418861.1 cell division protein FtsZ [Ramlibacter aurantiacus]
MSSSLTMGLAMLGGGTLAALIAWNAWTTRRNTPRQPEHDTVPLGDSVSTVPVEQLANEDGRVDPVFSDSALVHAVATPERRPGLDALIDVIAPISLEGPVSGDAALAAMPSTRRTGSKPFAIEALNERSGHWEMPQAGQRYTAFQAGVQLANRSGPLNEIEYSEFVMKAQAFADSVGGMPDFPEMRHEVARARELDQFASGHDAQLSLTLRARQTAWSPGYVQQHASRLGFVAGVVPGRLVLPAEHPGSPPVLVLTFDTQAALAEDPTQAALRDLTLTVDVPQVARTDQPFARMRDAATALGQSMDGILTDDRGQVIRDETLDAIGADLETLYDTLDARDLAAGSAQARRLFS